MNRTYYLGKPRKTRESVSLCRNSTATHHPYLKHYRSFASARVGSMSSSHAEHGDGVVVVELRVELADGAVLARDLMAGARGLSG